MKKSAFFISLILLLFFFRNTYGQENLSFTVNGITFNMIFVEGGTFVMGCTSEQGNCYVDERPSHKVTLTDYYMGEFQVTQQLWNAVMETNTQQQWLTTQLSDREHYNKINNVHRGLGEETINTTFDATLSEGLIRARKRPRTNEDVLFYAEDFKNAIQLNAEGDNYPMYFVNYRECELFCSKLTQLLLDVLPDGYRFRLPTEAQWEYAARGGKKSKGYTFSGSNSIDEIAWYSENSEKSTQEVGLKKKNELGIYDMSGNVWEWCRDRYSENYYSNSSATNPKGPEKGTQYVLRGGSWEQDLWNCRVATRNKDANTTRNTNYGFRIVLEPPEKLTGSGFFGYTGKFSTSRLSSKRNLTFKVNDQKMEMVFVEGGDFLMGCSSENNICDSIEKPIHNVNLFNYYIGKFEITQKLWNNVMGKTLQQQRDSVNSNWEIYGEGDNYPIYYVSYEECETFCKKLNKLLYKQLPENYEFKIPTEAQWEYAARGGKKGNDFTYSGSNNVSKVAWWVGNSGNKSREVGLKAGNQLGLFDMSGNVWEWCRDWFGDNYYKYGSTFNPQGPLSGTQRILRGGSWNLEEWYSRVTTRSYYEPDVCSANFGFRIVLEPAKKFFDIKSLKKAVKQLSTPLASTKSRIFKIDDIDFEMIFVEGGTFTMGCTSNFDDCFFNEEPAHSVTLSDFYVGKTQITQQLWTRVMGTTLQQQRDLGNPEWELCGEGDYYPMYYINYSECETFCEKLNQLLHKQLPQGYKFSLPTEAQWEYAARGGKKSKSYLYSGGDNIGETAWYIENCKKQLQTQEVGLKKKNVLGIYDMSGNVWEWCKDWFRHNYYTNSPSVNPAGAKTGYYRVLRGGSWRTSAKGCRVSYRFISSPNERTDNYGFRLALVKE